MTDQVRVPHTLQLLLERDLLALNRAVGALRRVNLPLESVRLGPAETPGLDWLTVTLKGDAASIDTAARKLRRLSGVRTVALVPTAEPRTVPV